MALTIYPATDWDSYISESGATTLLTSNIIDISAWTALTSTQKEIYLRQASQLIKLKIEDPQTESTPSDLKLATSHLAFYSIGKDMTNADSGKKNLKRIKIDGALEKEYFGQTKASNSFPDIVVQLLIQYGYSSSTKIVRS